MRRQAALGLLGAGATLVLGAGAAGAQQQPPYPVLPQAPGLGLGGVVGEGEGQALFSASLRRGRWYLVNVRAVGPAGVSCADGSTVLDPGVLAPGVDPATGQTLADQAGLGAACGGYSVFRAPVAGIDPPYTVSAMVEASDLPEVPFRIWLSRAGPGQRLPGVPLRRDAARGRLSALSANVVRFHRFRVPARRTVTVRMRTGQPFGLSLWGPRRRVVARGAPVRGGQAIRRVLPRGTYSASVDARQLAAGRYRLSVEGLRAPGRR